MGGIYVLIMRIPALGEIELLVPLHGGLLEQPLWATFLARLRSAASAQGAALLLEGGERVELRTGGIAAGTLEKLVMANPGLRDGRVYAQDELAASQVSGLPGGIRLVRIVTDDGIGAVLAVTDERPLGASIGSLLAALVPQFKVALKNLGSLERERARAALGEGVMARMNFGWISLDRQCRIVDCNPPAERVLRVSGLLRRGAYDRLVPSSPALDREMTALVARCADQPDMRPHALNLSHDPWIDLLLAPMRGQGLGNGGQAVALVYLRGDRTSQAARHEQLADLFQLTPSEARLAWSMAQGLTIAEAAREHGVTEETARYYSKKIYAKTGARGQVDLVRHILTSVLAFA